MNGPCNMGNRSFLLLFSFSNTKLLSPRVSLPFIPFPSVFISLCHLNWRDSSIAKKSIVPPTPRNKRIRNVFRCLSHSRGHFFHLFSRSLFLSHTHTTSRTEDQNLPCWRQSRARARSIDGWIRNQWKMKPYSVSFKEGLRGEKKSSYLPLTDPSNKNLFNRAKIFLFPFHFFLWDLGYFTKA